MIYTTAGDKSSRAINAEEVKEQISGLLIFNRENADKVDVLKELLATIDELPTLDTLDGKKMRRAYYPRVMVKDNCRDGAEPFQIGGNTHHMLEVRHTRDGSYLCFINAQSMVGTDYADEGYTFVGEKPFTEFEDDTEVVPFDEVWVEEEKEEQHG
jgi:hypothetical protein